MAGLPLTAWAIEHPWGDDTDAVLDRLHREPALPPAPAPARSTSALLERIAPRGVEACERWGPSRVAIVLGSVAPRVDEPLLRLSTTLEAIRERIRSAGPAYHVAATGAGGAKAIASAGRLLRAGLADAVLAGGIDDGMGALVLIEKHGDSFVQLEASAETSGSTDADHLDEAAMERALTRALAAVGDPALGYVQLHAPAGSGLVAVERRVVQSVLGATPSCMLRDPSRPEGAAAGAVGVVLAAASLLRGFAPEPEPRELEHDRVLVHAFSPGGHHVALVLGARP
ncbi:MAG: hypothetical protein KC501_04870 [Myxococcales bacterium]|nr:hypothetical protein [Myxococcales bacterium]